MAEGITDYRVAVVGSGPAAFYTAEALFKTGPAGVRVDLFDRLPVPFGLVRGGVAPDHQKIKSVTRVYDKIAANDGFRFFGNVQLGRDVSVEDLNARYHHVVYAFGCESDNKLGLDGERIGDYVERLTNLDEVQLVLLLQAGAMAFGCWRGEELLQHKAVRKYVVRGNGRSQATHLKTRGKSRYGSRLRLQNWKSLLVETCERLADCEQELGPFERVFYSAPVRVWSDLLETAAPPFARDDARLQRLPLHVHRPDHQELLRVRAAMASGRVVLPS